MIDDVLTVIRTELGPNATREEVEVFLNERFHPTRFDVTSYDGIHIEMDVTPAFPVNRTADLEA